MGFVLALLNDGHGVFLAIPLPKPHVPLIVRQQQLDFLSILSSGVEGAREVFIPLREIMQLIMEAFKQVFSWCSASWPSSIESYCFGGQVGQRMPKFVVRLELS